MASCVKFDPEEPHSSLIEAFQDFVSEFRYTYDALSRDPPTNLTDNAQRKTWREKDQRKVFLGRFSHRNLQKLYEEITSTDDERDNMTLDNMIKAFTDRFKLSTNLTLANYKFRKMTQQPEESFEAFTIRVKREAKNCDFTCGNGCTVINTLIRDQILFGTREDEVRKNALKSQWGLDDLQNQGRAIVASDKGVAMIKQEPSDEVRRTKPGKYSKKNVDHRKRTGNNTYSKEKSPDQAYSKKCSRCSQPRCDGDRKCPGRKATCFACGQGGHFRGATACKKKKRYVRNSRRVDGDSSSESSYYEQSDSQESETPVESEEEDPPEMNGSSPTINRVRFNIPTIRRINGRRYPAVRRAKSKYAIDVVICERKVPVFCDTGADVCIMDRSNAKRIGLDIMPTPMIIRPFGSKSQKCLGEATCVVRHNNNVANTKFYIMNKKVETLLSGAVCEELGIITLNVQETSDILRTEEVPEAKDRLMKKYPSIFSGVGTLKNYKVKFYVDENVPPVRQAARPIPFHLRDKLDIELEKMEQEDIIEPHEGPAPWISNTVLSPKDDGGTRVTVDMRAANKAIKQTNIPIPRPEEISSQLSGYKLFSKIDFKSAFHQLEIDEESRPLTVFHANGRLMRYKRLTMGTSPASGELNKALRPLFDDIDHAYVIQDDLIVAGQADEDHNATLDRVCQRIQDSGMTLNPEKCIIRSTTIPWWGMIISKNGVSPDPKKVQAVKSMSPPKSRDEVKSLFCMLQSNKNFIPSLATKTKNMRGLLKSETRFKWTNRCQEEFDAIKDEFSNDILLRHFNPRLKTEIQVDAHQSGLSAILVQEDKGSKVIVGVASRATTEVEARYPQIDLESLAVDFGLRRFRFYVAGGPKVMVITDHKPLCSIFKNLRTGSIRTERIKLRHQDIDYEVKWEKGVSNPADYLSRHAIPLGMTSQGIQKETSELEKTVWFLQYSPYTEAVNINNLINATNNDSTMMSLKKFIRKGYIPKSNTKLAPFSKIWNQLTISDSGLILKGDKIVIPESLVEIAIEKAHQGGHPGMTSMKRRLRSHFWCPRLNQRIENMVKSCKECTMFTPKTRKNVMHPHQLKDFNSWEKLSLDLFGPLPDQRHIIVAQDMVSKFPAAKILSKTDAKHVTGALKEFYNAYGTPIIHRTDNGPPFNSKAFADFSNDNGIYHEKSLPYHPQANPAEGFMKPLGKCIKTAHASGTDKSQAMDQFLSSYRATPHSATGMAPGDILFRHGYGNQFPRTDPSTDEAVRKALELDQITRERRDQELNTTRMDSNFQIGDRVLTRNNNHTKFQPGFGPTEMTVTALENGGIICVDKEGTCQRRHPDDVKPAPIETQKVGDMEVEDSNLEEETGTCTNERPVRKRRPNPKYKDYYMD